ncbi:MAG: hypothetical protein WEB53_08600 [Akkermansiaceae bacterium]
MLHSLSPFTQSPPATSENRVQWSTLLDGSDEPLVIDASPGTTTSHSVPTGGRPRRFVRVEVIAE